MGTIKGTRGTDRLWTVKFDRTLTLFNGKKRRFHVFFRDELCKLKGK